jgi:hypothetical protein
VPQVVFHHVSDNLAHMVGADFNQTGADLPVFSLTSQEIDCRGNRLLRVVPLNLAESARPNTE